MRPTSSRQKIAVFAYGVVLLVGWIGYWAWALEPSRVYREQPASSFAEHVVFTLMGFALAPQIDLTLLIIGFALAVRFVPPRLTGDAFGRVGLIIGLGIVLTIALISVAVVLVAPFVRPGCL